MADSIKLTTVCTAIAAQSVSVTNAAGASVTLSIKNITAIPEAVNQEDCPMLAPRPDNFVTNFSVARDSTGADASYKSARYTLNYVFYYAPVGQGSTLFSKYGEMVTAAAIVLNYFATNTALSGATDFLTGPIPAFGQMADVIGTNFHGCEMSFTVLQFMET